MSSLLCKISILIIAIVASNGFTFNKFSLSKQVKQLNEASATGTSKTALASSTILNPSTTRKVDPILGTFDYKTDSKLPWVQSGYKTWKFQGHNVNYIDVGNDSDVKKPPLLLIHGFGASIYHWRYNIPVLARDYHVYAIDLLGFGLSDKPIIDYSAELWRDQALAFIKEVVSEETGQKCVVAGNSLGGFTALYAASDAAATEGKGLINGAILLNAAGRFKEFATEEKEDTRPNW